MKERLIMLAVTMLMGVLIPWLTFGAYWEWMPEAPPVEETTAPAEPETQIPVYAEGVRLMGLEAYVTGVLLGEMPASFGFEAKKAQAVVARTYALRTIGRGNKHGVPSVCTDSACCQGYRSPEEYLHAGGSPEAVAEAERAVRETAGLVLTYNGDLAEATYFSCSGGMTEDAVAVWGTEIPYLQAVESPGEEHATHYTDTLVFSPEQFASALGVRLKGSPTAWFQGVRYTQGGGVEAMEIGGVTYTGTELRRLLGLRSTAFTVKADENQIRITTKGFGHRVGMSQYGADAMAAGGSNFRDILTHYYPGTAIDKAENLG